MNSHSVERAFQSYANVASASRIEGSTLDTGVDTSRALLQSSSRSFPIAERAALCRRCQTIQFDEIFNGRDAMCSSLSRWGRGVSVTIPADETCALCRFFATLANNSGQYSPLKSYPTKFHDTNNHVSKPPSLRLSVHDDSVDFSCNSVQFFGRLDEGDDLSGYQNHTTEKHFNVRVVSPRCDFRTPKEWLSLCRQSHSRTCGSVGDIVPGLHLIDCQDHKIVRMLSQNSDNGPFEYITLSYVWGEQQSEDIDTLSGLPRTLPTVVEDAIIVTEALGFRYLWVDRYCILQHASKEKDRQIKLMAQIYGNSALTIVDAAGSDSGHGLSGVSSDRRPQPRLQVGTHKLVSFLPSACQEIEKSSWATRGWTYQEGQLARRRLVFTPHQLYFQCLETHCCESASTSFQDTFGLFAYNLWPFRPYFSLHYSEKDQRDVLIRDISTYMSRELTHEADRLDAFFSLLNKSILDNTIDGQIVGLPLIESRDHWDSSGHNIVCLFSSRAEQLAVSLSWELKSDPDTGQPKFLRYSCFPSWSWIAWRCAGSGSTFSMVWNYARVEFRSGQVSLDIWAVFDDGMVLPWNESYEEIKTKLSCNISIRCLRLLAWTFTLGVGTLPGPVDLAGKSGTSSQSKDYHIKCVILGTQHTSSREVIVVALKCGKLVDDKTGCWRRVEPINIILRGSIDEGDAGKILRLDQRNLTQAWHGDAMLELCREQIDLY